MSAPEANKTAILRQATRADLPGIWEVRYAVRENTLTPGRISDEEVIEALEQTGRGWVIEVQARIVAFAIGNVQACSIWALFVRPEAQAQGHGSRLHDAMLAWLREQRVPSLWLSTGVDTQARKFYEAKGWQFAGMTEHGEARYEMKLQVVDNDVT